MEIKIIIMGCGGSKGVEEKKEEQWEERKKVD